MQDLVVVIGEAVGEENVRRLRDEFPQVGFYYCPGHDDFTAHAHLADVIFTKWFAPEVLNRATKLRWVQAGTAGIGHLLDMGLREREIVLTNAVGAHGVPISELILAMMLSFITGVHTLIRAQREHIRLGLEVRQSKGELAGQTLCVLGLGDIGGTLCSKAKALDMRVLGVRRSRAPFAGIDGQFTPDQLLQVLPQADHVALCLPLTAETTAIVAQAELRAMKSTAYIYNVGRGGSIEPAALERALTEGWIAGAGLDVTDPEPLPDDSPLWALPNVILSQHTSGSSPYNADRITQILCENLRRYLGGEPLQNVVDKRKGY